MLYHRPDGEQYEGWSVGSAAVQLGHDEPHRLILGVRCRLGGLDEDALALLDTGSQWSVLDPETAEALGDSLGDPLDELTMLTWRGSIDGVKHRVTISLLAEVGQSVEVDATVVVAEDWDGPLVLGFYGLLERVRLAIDPGVAAGGTPRLYFGVPG